MENVKLFELSNGDRVIARKTDGVNWNPTYEMFTEVDASECDDCDCLEYAGAYMVPVQSTSTWTLKGLKTLMESDLASIQKALLGKALDEEPLCQ